MTEPRTVSMTEAAWILSRQDYLMGIARIALELAKHERRWHRRRRRLKRLCRRIYLRSQRKTKGAE